MNRFPYGRTFLLGFGFLGVSILWSVYNSYVPVFLEQRFALSALAIGFIMTLDNIAALYIQPLIGVISDNTRTRFGRRMPYILVGAPIAAIGFVLIPMMFGLAGFIIAIGVTLLFMALWRTPVIALLGDLFPSEQRSKANGVINFMGGVGGILAYFGGGLLYGLNPGLPFWIGGALIVIAIAVFFWRIKEPMDIPAPTREGYGQLNKVLPGLALLILAAILWFLGVPKVLAILTGLAGFAVFLIQQLQGLPRQNRTSLVLLLLAIFSWFVGFSAIEAFFTLYGRNVLGIRENLATILFGISNVTFIIFAIPSGFIATRFGQEANDPDRPGHLLGLAGSGLLRPQGHLHRGDARAGRDGLGPGERQLPSNGSRHGPPGPAGDLDRPVLPVLDPGSRRRADHQRLDHRPDRAQLQHDHGRCPLLHGLGPALHARRAQGRGAGGGRSPTVAGC